MKEHETQCGQCAAWERENQEAIAEAMGKGKGGKGKGKDDRSRSPLRRVTSFDSVMRFIHESESRADLADIAKTAIDRLQSLV